MPDISIQFYATPGELLSFVKQVMEDYELHAVAMRFRPFEAREVYFSDLDALFELSSEYRRWAFTIDSPNLPVENELDHLDKNSSNLRLDVGRFDGITLSQSWLSCRTDDMASYSIWRKIAKKLKEITFPGVTARNRQNGVQSEYPRFRYSSGAKELEDNGVTILSTVGTKGPEIRLGLLLSQSTD